MDGITELAKMLKARDNPSVQGIGIGRVTSTPPNLQIMFNGFLLEKKMVVAAYGLAFAIGDSVIVIPSADNQRYFIVGKVG